MTFTGNLLWVQPVQMRGKKPMSFSADHNTSLTLSQIPVLLQPIPWMACTNMAAPASLLGSNALLAAMENHMKEIYLFQNQTWINCFMSTGFFSTHAQPCSPPRAQETWMNEQGTAATSAFQWCEDELLVLATSTALCGSSAVITNKLRAFYDNITWK